MRMIRYGALRSVAKREMRRAEGFVVGCHRWLVVLELLLRVRG